MTLMRLRRQWAKPPFGGALPVSAVFEPDRLLSIKGEVQPIGLPLADGVADRRPDLRFVTAQRGDSISSMLGASNPGAVGRFLALNGMDGRSSTISAGRSYAIPIQLDGLSDVEVSAGRRILYSDRSRLAARRARTGFASPQQDTFEQRFNSGRNVWTGELSNPPTQPPYRPSAKSRSWLDTSPMAMAAGGVVARRAGNIPGVARGAWHTVKGTVEGAEFLGRLMDPYDADFSPRGEAAWDKVAGVVGAVAKDPGVVWRGINQSLKRTWRGVDPKATRPADTFAGEFKRNFDIGLNQGELAFDIASLPIGLTKLRAVTGIGALSREELIASNLAKGYPPKIAEYLVEPYDGIGHHNLPRRTKLPDFLGGGPVPKVLLDSPFNVVKPSGMTKGDFYKLHYGVDDFYNGGQVPKRFGGGGWSGAKLGWQKYDRLGRLWYGTPDPLKAVIAAPVVGAGAWVDQAWDGAESQ